MLFKPSISMSHSILVGQLPLTYLDSSLYYYSVCVYFRDSFVGPKDDQTSCSCVMT